MEDDWQDQAAARLAQYGAPPMGEGPPMPPSRPWERPQAGGAQAAPVQPLPRSTVEEVYRQFQERMKYFEDLKKLGVPKDMLPNMGFEEGKTMPAYRPPGGLNYRNPGSLQRQFNEVAPYILPEDLDAAQELQEFKKEFMRQSDKYVGRET